MDAKLKRQLAQDALEESSMDISLDEIKFARAEDMEEIDEMEVGQEDEEVEGEESLTVLLNNKEAPANMGRFEKFLSSYIPNSERCGPEDIIQRLK
ncbi:hypothetical protein M8J76_003695 [Diaphorina citri]|nr:hypothetical protein M8J76_003695 [Diaphorina citri]KAI5731656.1 hypothetical protein M8J77_013871 [Diaphorina citri]